MMDDMDAQNEPLTKRIFFDAIGILESRIDAKLDAKIGALEARMDEKIDALALSTQQEFVVVNQEFAKVWKKLGEIEEKMVTKQDLFQFETRIMSAIGTIADEIKNLNSHVLILEKIVRL